MKKIRARCGSFVAETLQILAANEAATALYGYSAEEFKKLTLRDMRPPEDVARMEEAVRQDGEGPRHAGLWRHLRKNGSLLWAEVDSSAVLFEGTMARMSIILDVTERLAGEEKLRASEARLRAIIDNEPECVKTVSVGGQLLEMNPAGLRIIEADSIAQVRGQAVAELVHPEDRAAYGELHRRAAAGGTGQLQFRINGRKGTERWMHTHAVGLPDRDGRVTAVLSVARDITAQRKAEVVLRRQADMLDQIGQAVIATDLDGIVIYANRFAGQLYGWMSLAEMRGSDVLDLTAAEPSRAQAAEIMAELESGNEWSGEFLCRRRDGSNFEALREEFSPSRSNGETGRHSRHLLRHHCSQGNGSENSRERTGTTCAGRRAGDRTRATGRGAGGLEDRQLGN